MTFYDDVAALGVGAVTGPHCGAGIGSGLAGGQCERLAGIRRVNLPELAGLRDAADLNGDGVADVAVIVPPVAGGQSGIALPGETDSFPTGRHTGP